MSRAATQELHAEAEEPAVPQDEYLLSLQPETGILK
jgi:hypothetical protein